MWTPAVTARRAQTEDVAAIVLEAERAALAEVGHCQRQALGLVAASWLRAELLHKRTEARIKRLGERMNAAAQLRQVRISGEIAALAGDTDMPVAALEPIDGAVAGVVEELVDH